MAPFENAAVETEGEAFGNRSRETTTETLPGLDQIEKMNISRLFMKINTAMKALEGAVENFPDSKVLTNPNLELDVYPKIRSIIGRYKEENSLETKNKNTERDLSDYNEFKYSLNEFGKEVNQFLEELRARAMVKDRLMTKSQLKEKFHEFLDEPFSKLEKSASVFAAKS